MCSESVSNGRQGGEWTTYDKHGNVLKRTQMAKKGMMQVWPTAIGEMMKNGTREQIDRITQAFLPMKKFDIATLKRAYEGK